MAAATLVAAVGVPGALAGGPAAKAGKGPTWTMVNSAERATGTTPSGITVTVGKKLAPGTRVAKAEVLRADHNAPADEYLVPVNAKAVAGFSDLYEGFKVRPNGWSDVATLTFTFSRPVRNPRLHVAGTGGAVGDRAGNREEYWSGLRLTAASPARPAFTKVAGFPGFTVGEKDIVPTSVAGTRETTCGVVYMCGTAQIGGLVSSFTVDLRARNVRRGQPAGDPLMWGVFRVTFDEDVSDAPAGYGAATHVISDQAIGGDVSADLGSRVSPAPRSLNGTDADDAALVLPAGGFEARPGRPIQLAVPVRAASSATLAGWLDLDGDGRFQPSERAAATVAPGATRALLSWTPPRTVRSGATWLRLRLAGDAADVVNPTGWADSGEVEDHRVALQVPGVRLAHSATPRKARKGEAVTLVTTVTNTGRTAMPYRLTMDAAGLVDDARYRAFSPLPTSRAGSKLTWSGTLAPGQTQQIRVRAMVKRGEAGDGRLRTSWTGDNVVACVASGPGCGLAVPVRSRRSA
ncbi:GEVED domain-containing protein [Nonomuraea sp. NPDC050310]|uniref:GEVED domain-containing protein n=1 Tax=unclassified Nonomuraea TaxID=2593643 RepID=UPI0033DD1850